MNLMHMDAFRILPVHVCVWGGSGGGLPAYQSLQTLAKPYAFFAFCSPRRTTRKSHRTHATQEVRRQSSHGSEQAKNSIVLLLRQPQY
jgi:hypothetical protein